MAEDEPKSAYELAMEKLSRKDREEGREGPASLTAKQKEKIAEIRKEHEAKVAEMEIMYQANLSKAWREAEPEEAVRKIEELHRRDRQKIEEEKEARIAKFRQESSGAREGKGGARGRQR